MPDINDLCLKKAIKVTSEIANKYFIDHREPADSAAAATDAMFGDIGRDIYWQCVQQQSLPQHRQINPIPKGKTQGR